MAERDYETEAREQGWRPKEEFSGPEEKWTDAQTFVEKGEKIAGILKSRVDRLESRLSAAESANKEFGAYTKQQLDRQKQESAQRITELESQLAQAVTDGDGQAFTRLNNEISKERDSIPVEGQNQPDYNKLSEDWLRDNQWYNLDPDLQIYADGLAERVVQEGYQGKAYFNELTDRVKARFPEKFENPRKQGANNVDAGGEIETPDSKQAHTYENLPADAKAACDRFVAQELTTQEDYVENYEWD
jgi:hypothetical protein